jgi:hypothetical protein
MTTATEKEPYRHAGADWLQSNLDSAHRLSKEGRGQRNFPQLTVSPLGRCVADILGLVFGGLYHLPNNVTENKGWAHPSCIVLPLERELATIDFSHLWPIVALCQRCGIRVAIKPKNFKAMTLVFSCGNHFCGDIKAPADAVAYWLEVGSYIVERHADAILPLHTRT